MRNLIAASTLLLFAFVFAAGTARALTVSIEPADTTVALGDSLRLRVVATTFADLKGYQLVHSYDASKLSLIAERPGDVLTGHGGAWAAFQVPDVVAPADSAWLDAAMLDGSTSAPGVLAYLVFRATADGVAYVNCAHVELRDSQNAPALPDCAGGIVRVAAPVPVARRSWGRLKSAYR